MFENFGIKRYSLLIYDTKIDTCGTRKGARKANVTQSVKAELLVRPSASRTSSCYDARSRSIHPDVSSVPSISSGDNESKETPETHNPCEESIARDWCKTPTSRRIHT